MARRLGNKTPFEYELIDAGDRVLALIDQQMRGRSTGIDASVGNYAHLYTFTGGLIVYWKAYRSQPDALEAAGLSEPAPQGAENPEPRA